MRAMYICLCNAVTNHDIRRAAADGVRGFAELQSRTGCSDCCGSCEQEARQCLGDALNELHPSLAFVATTA
jgi:bacterioferritin-associated ferredoxin